MINDKISKIEEKISHSSNISENSKKDLIKLIADLKEEIKELESEHNEEAQSIAHFAESSAHEATKNNKNENLIEYSLKGLTMSVRDFETTYPKLTDTVNSIAEILSNLGI